MVPLRRMTQCQAKKLQSGEKVEAAIRSPRRPFELETLAQSVCRKQAGHDVPFDVVQGYDDSQGA